VDREYCLDRFDFCDHHLLHQNIETVPTIEFESFVNYRDGFLDAMSKSSKRKLVSQGRLIRGLSFSRTQFPMNLDSGADDLVGNVIRPHISSILNSAFLVNASSFTHASAAGAFVLALRRIPQRTPVEPQRREGRGEGNGAYVWNAYPAAPCYGSG